MPHFLLLQPSPVRACFFMRTLKRKCTADNDYRVTTRKKKEEQQIFIVNFEDLNKSEAAKSIQLESGVAPSPGEKQRKATTSETFNFRL